jgi:opacity protein-like surface antigen
MANALYQFDDGWLKPFVGAGLGFSVIDVDDLGAVGGAFVTDDTDTVFVANLIAGVDYPLSDMVTLTGRYTVGYSTKATFDTTAAGVDVDKDAQIHNYLSFGVRFDLN